MTKAIINDGGHGGSDPGARGYGGKVHEKEWTIEQAKYCHARFLELGVSSQLTRTSDVTLDSGPRTAKVRNSGADICLSHHFNAYNGEAIGCETIHSIYSHTKLAQLIADELHARGRKIRRVFSREGKHGDYYYMHRETGAVETIIVEYDFMDNKEAYNDLKDRSYREHLAEGVVKAVCKYIGHTYKAPKKAEEPKVVASSSKELHRVIVDGKQVNAFSSPDNAIDEVKRYIKKAKKIEIVIK